MKFPSFKNELSCINQGYQFVLGCDEVGVSPLAGPVVAATCLLNPLSIGKYRSKNKWYHRVRDSKLTNEKERQILLKQILSNTIAYGIGEVWQEDIDKLNIHKASLHAMKLATEACLKSLAHSNNKTNSPQKVFLFIDGRFKIKDLDTKDIFLEQKCVIFGDAKILSISAASIIAKVHRDNIMRELDLEFPEYGFAKHKGYGTKAHCDALKKLGVTNYHRRSFFKKGWLKDVKGVK